MPLLKELQRRNVFKVGIAYLVGSWLIIQVANILFESIGTPAWVLQTMFVVLGVGFFVTLFFAWAFELTPEGIKREREVDRSQSITHKTGRKLDFFIIGLLVVIAGYFIWESRFAEELKSGAQPISDSAGPVEYETAGQKLAAPPVTKPSRQSIAVLPFDNRSRLQEDEFFVAGMHDDLLTNLARISSLKVISRTSVNKYRDTEKTIPEIAAELGVATVMEGAVQRAGSTVRINVQLIDAQTDEHLWAEIFDRELTTDNLFAIQTEISQAIADALETTLTDAEQEQISRKPTDNLAAYNAYLLGRQLLPRRTSSAMEQALEQFQRAVELDENFALAWVGIAESAMLSRTYGTLSRANAMELMAPAIERALAIDPLLGEAYASQGQLHSMAGDDEKAERSFRLAIELNPNYPSSYHWLSLLLVNQPARAQEGISLIEKAIELDPLSPILRSVHGWNYESLGEYERAEQIYLELIDLDPQFVSAYMNLAEFYGDRMGRYDQAAEWNLRGRERDSGNMWFLVREFDSLQEVGADRLADQVYRRMENLDGQHSFVSYGGAKTSLRKGNIAAAREYAVALSGDTGGSFTKWMGGLIYAIDGDYQRARQLMLAIEPGYADRARWAELLETRQDDACTVAWVLMRTGDEELGRDLATRAVTYLEDVLPQYHKHADRFSVQACHAALGNIEGAITTLKIMVDHHHFDDWWWNRVWPPLRIIQDDPRFAAMDKQVKDELERQRVIVEALYAADGS